MMPLQGTLLPALLFGCVVYASTDAKICDEPVSAKFLTSDCETYSGNLVTCEMCTVPITQLWCLQGHIHYNYS
jgi:hypothetical protein